MLPSPTKIIRKCWKNFAKCLSSMMQRLLHITVFGSHIWFYFILHTVKKGLSDSRPQPGCHLPNSPWPGIIYPVPVPGRFGQNKSRNLLNFSYSAVHQTKIKAIRHGHQEPCLYIEDGRKKIMPPRFLYKMCKKNEAHPLFLYCTSTVSVPWGGFFERDCGEKTSGQPQV